jgi:hypothetical protein
MAVRANALGWRRRADAQFRLDIRLQLAPGHGAAVVRVHPAAGEDVLVRHEDMTAGALAHQDSWLRSVAPDQNQGRRILWARGALILQDDFVVAFLVECGPDQLRIAVCWNCVLSPSGVTSGSSAYAWAAFFY